MAAPRSRIAENFLSDGLFTNKTRWVSRVKTKIQIPKKTNTLFYYLRRNGSYLFGFIVNKLK